MKISDKREQLTYHLMLLPGVILLAIFSIYPILGIQLAFKTLNPTKGIWGSPWVGLANFKFLMMNPQFPVVLRNTLFISIGKIILGLIIPIIFALMLNELRGKLFKKSVQSIVYLPHFMSWVILGGVFREMFSSEGLINQIIKLFNHGTPIMLMGNSTVFPHILIGTDVWQNYGFNAIIYLAALTAIDPSLYEAAEMDGASRWAQLKNITLPGIKTTIVLLATLSLQQILNAGFDQVYNMYNPLVYSTGDILDTYVFRLGLQQAQYEIGTALGLFKSVISFVFIVVAVKLAAKFANYRIL